MSTKIRLLSILLSAAVLVVTSPISVLAMTPMNVSQETRDINLQLHFSNCTDSSGAANSLTSNANPGGGSVASGEGGGCGNDADNDPANKQQVWSFLMNKFKSKGYNDAEAEAATSGVMGNWAQESGFDSYKTTEGMGCNDSPAYGIAQWCFGRIDKLKQFASDRNKPPTCLGVQLEYMWSEMEGSYSHLITGMKGMSPADAASAFNLGTGTSGGGFEVGADDDKRRNFADQVYGEFTGKGAGSISPNSTTEKNGETCTNAGTAASSLSSNNPIPSADCDQLKEKIKDLTKKGVIQQASARQDNDLKNCTTDSVPCGTVPGKGQSEVNPDGGGVHPGILRVTAAIAENSGSGPLVLWSFNSGHECDNLNHPHGKAVDIPCGDSGQGAYTDMKKCEAIINYLLLHKEELGISELLWQTGYKCDAGVNCNVDGHGDHIHVGIR